MLPLLPVIVGSYLWGGVPSGYLVARYVRGIDLREHGSGNVGAANLMVQVGFWSGLALGLFDCLGKGTLPVVAARWAGLDAGAQAAAGLAAIAGHDWSPYLRLTGGRGVATSIGVVAAFFMWKEALILGFALGIVGRVLLRETGFWTLVSAIALPLLAWAFGRPPEVVYLTLGVATLLALKRLTANWEAPPQGHGMGRVLLRRLLWDRDVPPQDEWVNRRRAPRRESRGDA